MKNNWNYSKDLHQTLNQTSHKNRIKLTEEEVICPKLIILDSYEIKYENLFLKYLIN